MTTTDQQSVPPQSIEAEESVLAAMMIAPGAIDAVTEILDQSDFYRESHAKIYRAAQSLHTRLMPVDAITLTDELDFRGELEDVGGRVRLHELGALVPASGNAAHYARIVREFSVLRHLIRVGGEIQRLGWERPGTADELTEQAEGIVFDLGQHGVRSDLIPIGNAVPAAWQRLVELHERGAADVVGVPAGLLDLDRITAGFHPGNLIVLAARPSMGKTALGLGIAAHVAIHRSIPVALFTLEMNRAEIIGRLWSSEGGVDSQRVRTGRLEATDWNKLSAAASVVEKAPLLIDDSAGLTMNELRSRARRAKLRTPDLGLIIVDYLQLMSSGAKADNRVQEVSQISRALKILASDLEVPIIALSQLSRAVEQRHDKRPILSDLRESGSIEQDADVVLFLYRDEYYNPESAAELGTDGVAEIEVAKQRNGPTDRVKVAFVKRYARFNDLAPPGA